MNKNNLIFGTGFNDNPKKFLKKKFINSINYCADNGINLFDTGDNYFNGDIQKIIGNEISKKKMNIINKFQIFNNKKILQKNLDHSLLRLKRDSIEYYMPHWPIYNMDLNLIIDFIYENIEKKKIINFGLSNFNLEMIKKIRKIFNKNITIQNEINLCNYNFNKKLIKYCTNNKIKIIAYKISENFPKNFIKSNNLKNLNNYEISLVWLKKLGICPIIKSLNVKNINKNLKIYKKKFLNVKFELKNNFQNIPIKKIRKINSGSNTVYKSIKDAITNKNNLYPSPIDISKEIKRYGLLKPFFVKRFDSEYELVSGQARFWAYLMLNKKKKFLKSIVIE